MARMEPTWKPWWLSFKEVARVPTSVQVENGSCKAQQAMMLLVTVTVVARPFYFSIFSLCFKIFPKEMTWQRALFVCTGRTRPVRCACCHI